MGTGGDVDIAIVGAGTAGLGAAKTLAERGISFVLLEAAHRIGGRAYTEEILPDVPFDLGCHWMHSASLNPFVAIADAHGATYTKEGFERGAFRDGAWVDKQELAAFSAFYEEQEERLERAAEAPEDVSVYEATEREHRFTGDYDYYMSLHTSFDPDQISVHDLCTYVDTGEDWPLRDGYGTLVSRWAADVPVSLNTAVTEIDWSGTGVQLETPKGTVTAKKVLITVSTGVLGAGDIRFTPGLPDWKLSAVEKLPLGCHNRIAVAFDRDPFGSDAPSGGLIRIGDSEPMSVRVKPFAFPYAVGVTGGRFGDWLERAGQEASVEFLCERLRAAFGSDITKHVVAEKATAWRGDPWVRGAYSSAQPGEAGQRDKLREPVDDRLWFAGEATSTKVFSTAHGAYLSGVEAANAIL